MMIIPQYKKNNVSNNAPNLLAENLTTLLKLHHLNAAELAQSIGIPLMTIRRLLSGETADPRISTLKLIADHFNITIDHLLNKDPKHVLTSLSPTTHYLVPKINWDTLSKISDITNLTFDNWSEWQSIAIHSNHPLSKSTFALESRPSMYQRYPKGTLFIIDPATTPNDGDIILIQLKENQEVTLRELIIDPPNWRLSPLVNDSTIFNFSKEKHQIIGVSILTMRYTLNQ